MGENFIIRDGVPYYKSTLAHFLDNRSVSNGEPSASDLPSEVNPLETIMSLLGSHLVVVKVRDDCVSGDLMGSLGKIAAFMPIGESLKVVTCVDCEPDWMLPSVMEETCRVSDVCKFDDYIAKEGVDG